MEIQNQFIVCTMQNQMTALIGLPLRNLQSIISLMERLYLLPGF